MMAFTHMQEVEEMTVGATFVFLWATILLFIPNYGVSQQAGSGGSEYGPVAQEITDRALTDLGAFPLLWELTQTVGARLSGSPEAAAAVEWGKQAMKSAGLDSVFLQPVMVPHWVRGSLEEAAIINSRRVGTVPISICALGGSVPTAPEGIVAEVIEVQNFEEVAALKAEARGKIIFYNRPMDPTRLNPFAAYVGAVNQRSRGAIEAAKVGAAAVLVRSMTTRFDDVPHTGAMHYDSDVPQIPAAAISTVDANFLSNLLANEKSVKVFLQLDCRTLPDELSYNVVGEIRGSELPGEVVLLGAHLDSWDKGEGAHDDGAGVVQVIEALRLLKALGLQPRRTIRGVLYMNEENGVRGGKAYADSVANSKLKHIAALESDRGGFTPRGFDVDASPEIIERIQQWKDILQPLDATRIQKGYGGVDISPLKTFGTPLLGLVVDSQRYFDYHHSDNDTIDKVNERELELGAAAMAIMAYLLAQEGL